MKHNLRTRLLSLLLCVSMMVSVFAHVTPVKSAEEAEEETVLSTEVTTPFRSDVEFEVGGVTVTSNSYRIPSMVTLADGTIVAAADIRWNTTYDGGGLDTLVARSTDGGVTWNYTVANYLGDNGNQYSGSSTCFIDPSLTVAADGKTIYMLTDLYPYGVALNGNKETTPSSAVGFNDDGYLKLSADNHSSYAYYLKDGLIYNSSDAAVDGYTVDAYFNLYKDGTLTSNLFYSDSPYKVVRTGFLYLISSTDAGETWSEPMLLNLKTSFENVCLVGPGRGITTADGTMVFPVYSYGGDEDSQRVGFVYSQDGVNWERAQSSVSWSSEAAVVEIGEGTLRFFYRNGTTNLCYVDYDMNEETWGSYVNTGVDTNSNTQISAITYSKTSGGKQVVLVSCPTGPNEAGSDNNNGGYRLNGYIFAGLVNDDGTMTWSKAVKVTEATAVSADTTTPYTEDEGFFAYSCLTERSDGSIAILYENRENAWGTGDDCYYAMNLKAYSSDDLGITFDNVTEETKQNPSSIISANGVIVSSTQVSFTGLTVTTTTAPTASYINRAVAYDVVPETADGVYTGYARVTIEIPDGWDSDKVYGFVVEEDGSVTTLPGSVSTTGTFSYVTPHFSETGLYEATATAEVTEGTVVLEIGETSGEIVVSDSANVGTEGTNTVDGKVSYTVEHSSGDKTLNEVTSAIFEDGKQYILISERSSSEGLLTTDKYSATISWSGVQIVGLNTHGIVSPDTNYIWGIEKATDSGYYIKSSDNKYLTFAYEAKKSTAELTDTETVLQLSYQGGYWYITNSEGVYLSNVGGFVSGYYGASGFNEMGGSGWKIFEVNNNTGTTVTFTGLDVTTGTEIMIGDMTYTVIVNAKTAEKSEFLKTGSTLMLDAVSDLGLSGDYGVTYAVTATDADGIVALGDDGQITSNSQTGEVTVLATVKNASDVVVGTVTYTITVSDVEITDVKNIYVSVGHSAEISGLNEAAEMYEGMYDASIATAIFADGKLSVTGVAEGKTAVVIGGVQINIYVVPANTGSGANTEKYIYIYVEKMENCEVYYAINGGSLYKVEGTGVLIGEDEDNKEDAQKFTDGFNIMFFAVPDEGYVLTEMSAEQKTSEANEYTEMPDFYSLFGTAVDGTDSDAWPFAEDFEWSDDLDCTEYNNDTYKNDKSIWKSFKFDDDTESIHGFRWALMEGSMSVGAMRTLFTNAKVLGAEGATTITKNSKGGNIWAKFSFIAEKLPTLEKEIISYKRNGVENTYTEETTLEFGDVVTYQFTVTAYSTNVNYSNIELSDTIIKYKNDTIDGGTFNTAGTYTYTADYTIKSDDLIEYANGKFVNTAHLKYTYGSRFSTGTNESISTASVSCKINGIVYYVWADDVPDAITSDVTTYPLPGSSVVTYGEEFKVQSYSGQTNYNVVVNGVTVGTWTFDGWYYNGQKYTGEESVTMPQNDSVEFVGVWIYEEKEIFLYYKIVGSVGGTLSAESESIKISTDNTAVGSTATVSSTDAYRFDGWYSDEECKTLLTSDATYVPTKDADELWVDGTTFYAKFEEREVTINYVPVGPAGVTNFGTVDPNSETLKVVTGETTGSTPTASSSVYKFVGWYTDEACTAKVPDTWVDGNGKIIPQKTGDLWVAATYYAKFEYNLTSLTIVKVGAEDYKDIDPNQTFIFNISGNGIDLDVTVHRDANGNWSTTIDGLTVGATYTITEKTDWSWRYNCTGWTHTNGGIGTLNVATITLGLDGTITFTNTRSNEQWLDGDSYKVNIFN